MIKFYTTKGQFGCFSNFSKHQLIVDGKIYPNSESYYQSMKFLTTDPIYSEQIRSAPNPKEAARLGRTNRVPGIREDWDQVKDDIMRKAVRKKFETHPGIRKILLGTDNQELVEDSSSDSYWGCGSDGRGKNMLGVILQEIRSELRVKYAAPE